MPHGLISRSKSLPLAVVAGFLLLLTGDGALNAQGSAEQVKARLEVGAGFLKAGETELAAKTFATVLDADPTNWQARSLLTLTYLSTRDLEKVDAEVRRMKAMSNVPPATLSAIERQVDGVRRAIQLRDQVTGLLQKGKWQEAIASMDATDAPAARKQLLRAYIAVMRGEFDEASRLTADPQFASFNASVVKREEDLKIAREKALVALNFLGGRYCGGSEIMRRCPGQPPLNPAQEAAWHEIRSGDGKVDQRFMQDKFKRPREGAAFNAYVGDVFQASRVRTETAVALLARFRSLAPLRPEAVHAGVVLSMYSGSLDAVRESAELSRNLSGRWALRVRACKGRTGCWLGIDTIEQPLLAEGLLIVDSTARTVGLYRLPSKDWLMSLLPTAGPAIFEMPFEKVVTLRSRPKVKAYPGTPMNWLETDSLFLEFGAKQSVRMPLDFTLPLTSSVAGDLFPVGMKSMGDVIKVIGELIPNAKVDFEIDAGGGSSFGQILGTAGLIAGAALRDPGVIAQSQQTIKEADQRAAVDEANRAALWRAVSDLKAQDGKSMLDAAFDDEALKKDLDALLNLALK